MNKTLPVVYKKLYKRSTYEIVKDQIEYEKRNIIDVGIEVDITDSSFNIYKYSGSIFSKTKDIVKYLGVKGEIYLIRGRKINKLERNSRPLLSCIYFEEEKINLFSNCKFVIEIKKTSEMKIRIANIFKKGIQILEFCMKLRKLVVKNCLVKYVDLRSLTKIEHVDMYHNYIESIIIEKKITFCNLSYNNLKETGSIKSNHLNLSNNKISYFISKNKYQLLNLKNNPLKICVCNTQMLDITNTKVRNLSCFIIKRLFCNTVKGINLHDVNMLVYLSVNDCKLKRIRNAGKKLKVLNACNNLLTCIPTLSNLKYLNASCNYISHIKSYNVEYLNISRNSLSIFRFKNFPNLKFLDLSYNIVFLDLKFVPDRLQKIFLQKSKETSEYVHVCNKVYKNIEKVIFTSPTVLYSRLYSTFIGEKVYELEGILNFIFKDMNALDNRIAFLDVYHSKLKSILFKFGYSINFYTVLITEQHVLIKNEGADVIFNNFLQCKKLTAHKSCYIFNNFGKWNCFPLLCTKVLLNNRYDLFHSHNNFFVDTCNFLNCRCSIALNIGIYNTPIFYESSFYVRSLLKTVSSFSTEIPNKCFKEECKKIILQDLNIPNMDYKNYDNPDYQDTSIANNEETTFIYIKFTSEKYRNIHKKKLKSCLEMMTTYFQIRTYENYEIDGCIFIGETKLEALLFSLYIQKILLPNRINTSIGISCGEFFIRWSLDLPKLFGIVLNKVSRISSMGIGVFCCSCVKISYPTISFTCLGKRYLRGFEKYHDIYHVHFKHE